MGTGFQRAIVSCVAYNNAECLPMRSFQNAPGAWPIPYQQWRLLNSYTQDESVIKVRHEILFVIHRMSMCFCLSRYLFLASPILYSFLFVSVGVSLGLTVSISVSLSVPSLSHSISSSLSRTHTNTHRGTHLITFNQLTTSLSRSLPKILKNWTQLSLIIVCWSFSRRPFWKLFFFSNSFGRQCHVAYDLWGILGQGGHFYVRVMHRFTFHLQIQDGHHLENGS